MKKLLLALISVATIATAQSGQLAILVLDPVGKPVSNAIVTISTRPMVIGPGNTAALSVPYNASAHSDVKGSVLFAAVPVAAFAICASLPNSQFVDTCSFSEHPPSVVVLPSQLNSTSVTLLQGSVVSVTVSDVQQVLQTNTGLINRQLRLGITVPKGPWRPMFLKSSTPQARTYSLLVPVGIDLNLVISGGGFRVADSSGLELKSNGRPPIVRFKIPATAKTFDLRVGLIGIT